MAHKPPIGKLPRYPRSRATRTLLPHQKDALRYMMRTDTPALFLDMRLGKTILTIEYAIRKGLRNVLVVAPMSALNSWEKELEVERIPCCKVLDRKKSTLENLLIKPWVLTNPQKIAQPRAHVGTKRKSKPYPFLSRKWDLIVIDESSRIKNARSNYFKELMKHYTYIKHKILLSGTPTPESILEAVPQLLFLHGEVMGCKSYWEFLSRYTVLYGYDRILYRDAREELKSVLNAKCYFLTQKQAGLANPVRHVVVNLKKNPEQLSLIRKLRSDFELDFNGKHYETDCVLPTLMWACRIAGGILDNKIISEAKYDSLLTIARQTSGQIVVWFRFNEELHFCASRLARAGYRVASYYGDVSVQERKLLEQRFRERDIDILCMQVKTGLYALDLSCADTAVYYSNSWSLEERLQSEKRIAHPRKSGTLIYYDLVTKGWPDTTIYNALKKKNVSVRAIWEDYDKTELGSAVR